MNKLSASQLQWIFFSHVQTKSSSWTRNNNNSSVAEGEAVDHEEMQAAEGEVWEAEETPEAEEVEVESAPSTINR